MTQRWLFCLLACIQIVDGGIRCSGARRSGSRAGVGCLVCTLRLCSADFVTCLLEWEIAMHDGKQDTRTASCVFGAQNMHVGAAVLACPVRAWPQAYTPPPGVCAGASGQYSIDVPHIPLAVCCLGVCARHSDVL